MKKISSMIIIFISVILSSCNSNDSLGSLDQSEKFAKVKLDKSSLLKSREIELNSGELNKINSFVDNRIEQIQKTIGITEDGVLSLTSVSVMNSDCSDNYSLNKKELPKYEIIAISSKDGRIEGYLWNVYGSKVKSFYQQVKYNEDGTLKETTLFSNNNKAFFSTNKDLLMAKVSTNSEGGEEYEMCVARVFAAAQDACAKDVKCNLRCNVLPGFCEGCMLAAAAIACIIYS